MANSKVNGHFDNAERVRLNQQQLMAELKPHHDFMVCGSVSFGSICVYWRSILLNHNKTQFRHLAPSRGLLLEQMS
jgi:hypothetical protein